MGFSRQEYWSGLPFPSPGDLPDPGVEPRSPTLQADSIIWATRECPDTYCFCCFSFPCEVLHFSYWWVFSLDVGLWWTPVLWALEPLAVLLSSNFMFSDESCEDIPHNDTHRGTNSDWKVFSYFKVISVFAFQRFDSDMCKHDCLWICPLWGLTWWLEYVTLCFGKLEHVSNYFLHHTIPFFPEFWCLVLICFFVFSHRPLISVRGFQYYSSDLLEWIVLLICYQGTDVFLYKLDSASETRKYFVFWFLYFSGLNFHLLLFFISHFSSEKLFLPICLKSAHISSWSAVIIAVSKICLIIPTSVSPGVGIS